MKLPSPSPLPQGERDAVTPPLAAENHKVEIKLDPPRLLMKGESMLGHILIVDDEVQIHTVVGKLLSKEGYEISDAFSAEEAYQKMEEKRPDLVILDVMMPKVSGIEVCNRLKSNPKTRDILVLILSAKEAQADRIEGLTHGADDFVSKPFHLRSLVRKIQHMLEKKTT